MNQYAGALIVCVCLGAVAAIGAGCDSGSDNAVAAAGNTGVAGNGTVTPGAGAGAVLAGAGAGNPPGTAATGNVPSGGGAAPTAGNETLLPSGGSGFVQADMLGIKGSWYPYGDGINDKAMPMGTCQAAGHMTSECSLIKTPDPAAMMFPPTDATISSMCTSGTIAKVIAKTTPAGSTCGAVTTGCDYSAIFGAGIGLDLNNGGLDGGMGKLGFNATAANIVGIAFDIDAVPLAGLRVEFPTTTTADTAAIWMPGTAAKNFVSPVVVGHNVIPFSAVVQPSYIMGAMPLNASDIVSIQFHVPSSTSGGGDYAFCISNLAVVTM